MRRGEAETSPETVASMPNSAAGIGAFSGVCRHCQCYHRKNVYYQLRCVNRFAIYGNILMGLVPGLLLLIALALSGCAVTPAPTPESAAGGAAGGGPAVGRRPQALTPAGTEVGGLVRPDTTWTAAGSPYIVTATVQVPKGGTLVIEQGVVVKFHPGLSLQVDGTLVARGTVHAPITFTSGVDEPAPADWESILFADSSLDASYDEAGSYLSGSILEHCSIEAAGAGGSAALKLDHAGPFKIGRAHV